MHHDDDDDDDEEEEEEEDEDEDDDVPDVPDDPDVPDVPDDPDDPDDHDHVGDGAGSCWQSMFVYLAMWFLLICVISHHLLSARFLLFNP